MDIHSVRQQLRMKSIYDIPLRVTYYARVSSESDEQLNSLGNQISYYEDFIRKSAAWTFVPGYIDEGLSGISTKRRENFNRMVDDAETGKFDLVITKEISRFARNTLDSIQYTRQLLNAGVGVFFQNDNINTFDEDSELRLSIMSSIAQDELRKLSSRVKFGHQQAIKQNVVLGNSRIFGYIKNDGRLVIDNKVKVVDMFTKKQKFLPPEEWVMFKDETGEIVPAIVSEELWEQANAVLRRRSEDVKNRQGVCNHANLLTGKLFCTHCGTPYYRRDSVDRQGNKNSKWVCSGKINNGKDSCDSIPIYEKELIPLLFEVFRDTKEASAAMLEEYERMYRSMTSDGNIEKKIEAVQATIELTLKKKSKLLEFVALDSITPADFKSMTAQCNADIKAAEQELAELREQQESSEEFRSNMERIRKVLRDAERDCQNGEITKEFIDTFIDKIFATPEGDGTMRLDIKIFTGESCEKYLQKLKRRANFEGCTGHTFKKMIEAQERQMAGK